jgi:tripartite-type tricarboxylate transporter receptor subunit TctC
MALNPVRCLCLPMFAALLVAAHSARAQETSPYPNRQVKMFVPYSPGGAPDAIARALAQRLSEEFGQPFLVENKAGAGGVIAADALAKSAPDGYTLCICDSAQWAIQPALQKSLPYDATKDFQAITMLARTGIFLAVNSKLPVANLAEFIALVKRSPGKYNYGSPGIGSLHHLTTETFKANAGLQMEHVPYKGGADMVPALLSGEITAMFQAMPSIAGQLKQGNFKLFAVALAQRSPLAAEIPTFAEQGVPGIDFPGEFAMLAPAAIPLPVVSRISTATVAALKHPAVAERFRALAMEAIPSTPEAAMAVMKEGLQKIERAAVVSGLKR